MTPAELDELQANIAEFMDTHPAYHYPHLLNEAADALSTLRADLAAKERALRKAEITIRQRQHPANEPRDPPNVLVTLGFWPDCGCGECYAIHCLDEQMTRAEHAESEFAAVRELMNIYNLGGWTDAVAPMQRALKAEAEEAALAAENDALLARAQKAEAERDDLIRENEALHGVHDELLKCRARWAELERVYESAKAFIDAAREVKP